MNGLNYANNIIQKLNHKIHWIKHLFFLMGWHKFNDFKDAGTIYFEEKNHCYFFKNII